jgi:hypothetical protein
MRGSSRSTQHTSSEYSSPPHHDRRSSLKRNAQRTITTARVRASRCESPRPRWMRQPESRWYTTSRNSRIGFDGTHTHTQTHTHTHPLVSFQPLAAYNAVQPCNKRPYSFRSDGGQAVQRERESLPSSHQHTHLNRSCVCVCVQRPDLTTTVSPAQATSWVHHTPSTYITIWCGRFQPSPAQHAKCDEHD